jgi:hypothetical protein
MWIKTGKQEVGIWWFQKRFPRYGIPMWSFLIKIRSTRLLPILDLIIPPVPEGGGGYTVLPLSVRHVKSEYIFFSCPAKFFSSRFRIKIIFRKKNIRLKLNSLRGKLIKKNCKTKMVLPYTNKKRNKTVVIRKSHEKICIIIYLPFSQYNHIQNFEEKKLFQHFANLIKIRSTRLLPILDLIIPPVPEGGGKKNCKTKMVLPYTNKKRNKTVVIRKSHEKIFPSLCKLFHL